MAVIAGPLCEVARDRLYKGHRQWIWRLAEGHRASASGAVTDWCC